MLHAISEHVEPSFTVTLAEDVVAQADAWQLDNIKVLHWHLFMQTSGLTGIQRRRKRRVLLMKLLPTTQRLQARHQRRRKSCQCRRPRTMEWGQ